MSNDNHKAVNDLGVAAFLLLHGYKVVGKRAKTFYFECDSSKTSHEIDILMLEYQPPNEFYTFDSCLMFLKKISECQPVLMEDETHKNIHDLGMAAYVLMQEYKPKRLGVRVVGKKGSHVCFEYPADKKQELDRLCYEYLPSQFQTYDSNLMALKKIGEYMSKPFRG